MSLNLCGTIGGNTGPIDCDVARGIAMVPIIGGKSFVAADYATQAAFAAALIAACKLATGNGNKLFPFPLSQDVAEKTPANKEGTLGLGFTQTLLEGRPAYETQVLIGQTQFQNLRKWNRVIAPVFMLDDQNNVWGKLNSDGSFVGLQAYIFVSGLPFGDGAKNITAKISISFLSAADFNDNCAYMGIPANTTLTGLKNVVLTVNTGGHASNVWHISANILTAALGKKINLEQNGYAMLLASAALWTASTPAGSLAITSVADDPTNGGWTVTFNSAAYTALAAATQITLSLADPTTLDTANVTGVECTTPVICVTP
ncbi:MAG: hypothetical protein Q8943_17430 [Bacteroidota bacterium]|nr:hypothetical protein [Bacteroidota bacterium]